MSGFRYLSKVRYFFSITLPYLCDFASVLQMCATSFSAKLLKLTLPYEYFSKSLNPLKDLIPWSLSFINYANEMLGQM